MKKNKMDFLITLEKLDKIIKQEAELSKSQIVELFVTLIADIKDETITLVDEATENTKEEIVASISNLRTEVGDDFEEVRLSVRDVERDISDLDGEVLDIRDKIETLKS